MTENFVFLLLGMATGLFGVLLGLGGGLFLVPVLTVYFHVSLPQAIACSVLNVIATSSLVSISNMRSGMVDLVLASRLEMIMIAAGACGGWLGQLLSTQSIKIVFLGMLIISFVSLLLQKDPQRFAKNPKNISKQAKNPMISDFILDFIGGINGILAGMLGTGGGSILIPALVRFKGKSLHEAVAISAYIMGMTGIGNMLVISGTSAGSGAGNGNINLVMACFVILGSYFGAQFGHRIKGYFSFEKLRFLFMAFLFITTLKMARG